MTWQFFSKPYPHWIKEDFFSPELAVKLSTEFPSKKWSKWYTYSSPLEEKRTFGTLSEMPSTTKSTINTLTSALYTEEVASITGWEDTLVADTTLHGAGMHSSFTGGKLNIHLDYEVHPVLNLNRKFNLIVYLTRNWDPVWGGALELWGGNNQKPHRKEKVIENKFNRAIIFDTSCNSWHGFPEKISCPPGVSRNSLALYWLTPVEGKDTRYRTKFSITEGQLETKELLTLIEERGKW